MIKFAAVLCLVVLFAGCNSAPSADGVVVRQFCDEEMSHSLRKTKDGYLLVLRIGEAANPRVACRFGTLNRRVSLRQVVSSTEEADALIAEYRSKYAGKGDSTP
ncbi:MAG: hypothetical protein Q7R69_01150 [bacterium]|nr:hypothetical protein [bacterium]